MIKIIADSTCDLSKELLKKYDIGIIPLCVEMGEDTYHDGFDITPEDIYEWSERENSTPKTAAPLLNDVIEFLRPYVEGKMEILFFGISESMSSSCNVVRLAAEFFEYSKIHIINSGNLSTGIGLQVIKAACLVEEGKELEEIAAYIEGHMRPRVRASFVVDTLTFLQRGGRCSAVTALIGNTLKLKPTIYVRDGKMEVGKKYRGGTKKVLLNYVQDLTEGLQGADPERVFITHSGCGEETIREVRTYLEELGVFREILVTRAGGVISSHCGPKTLGVLYVER